MKHPPKAKVPALFTDDTYVSQLETTLTARSPQFHSGTAPEQKAIGSRPHPTAQTADYCAPIASMLLGLRYRTELTPAEQALLDELAGPDGISFLLLGQTYLHPAGAELFPLEDIRAAATAPVGTVFSQVKKARTRNQNDYLMMSVTISDQILGRLLFGTLIPVGLRRDHTALNRFHEIARQFTLAESTISQMSAQLAGATSTTEPWILVNRASGRTISVNSAAARLLKSNTSDLIDCEFGSLRKRLGAVIGRGLTMTSLGDDLLPLCMIKVESSPLVQPEPAADLFLIEQMHNTLAGLRSAASHLHATTCWKHETDEADLAQLIENSASDLDRQMYRLHLLTNFDRIEKQPIELTRAARTAAEQLRREHPSIRSIFVHGDTNGATIPTPAGALEQLIEMTVQSHTRDFVDPASVEIETSAVDSALRLTVSTTLPNRRRSSNAITGWHALVSRLSSFLTGKLETSTDPQKNTLITTIDFNDKPRN